MKSQTFKKKTVRTLTDVVQYVKCYSTDTYLLEFIKETGVLVLH